MYRLENLFKWLSLDIAFGGAILFYFVSTKVYGIATDLLLLVALFVSIVAIYTTDHLRDAMRINRPTLGRHIFHKKHQKGLVLFLVLLGLSGIFIVPYLPTEILWAGFILSSVSVIYLMIANLLGAHGMKEILVSVVYGTTMFIVPICFSSLGIMDFVMMIQLVILAFTNLVIISYFEIDQDEKDQTKSLVSVIGYRRSRLLISSLLIVGSGTSFILFTILFDMYQGFLIMASAVLTLVFIFKPYLTRNDLYRWLSDGIFYLPIIYLLDGLF